MQCVDTKHKKGGWKIVEVALLQGFDYLCQSSGSEVTWTGCRGYFFAYNVIRPLLGLSQLTQPYERTVRWMNRRSPFGYVN